MTDTFTQTAADPSPAPQHPACDLCRYWDSSVQMDGVQSDTTGLCRRQPPKVNKMTGGAMWPFTDDSDWCGSYKIDPAKDNSPLPF